MVVVRQKGSFRNTEKFLSRAKKLEISRILNEYGRQGVAALSTATPVDTGKTSQSWDYEIQMSSNGYRVVWTNSNVVDGVSVAILLQYGHATGNGGYVEGLYYINPAMQPIFIKMAEESWREVTR